MKHSASLRTLLKRVHQDERGSVSLETILIIGAIALPILIFLIKVGWPRVKDYFTQGLEDLEEGSQKPGGKVFGKSITDPCLNWESSERLVQEIAELV